MSISINYTCLLDEFFYSEIQFTRSWPSELHEMLFQNNKLFMSMRNYPGGEFWNPHNILKIEESAAGVTSSCFVRLEKQMKEFYEKSFYFLFEFLMFLRQARRRNWVKSSFPLFFFTMKMSRNLFVRDYIWIFIT